MSKTPNGYSESVESLFMDRNGLPDNHYLSPLRALDNPTPGTIKKWLTRPERSSDQSLSCSGLQVQEIRLLSDEESVNWLTVEVTIAMGAVLVSTLRYSFCYFFLLIYCHWNKDFKLWKLFWVIEKFGTRRSKEGLKVTWRKTKLHALLDEHGCF